jgi:spore coat protein U-like protein
MKVLVLAGLLAAPLLTKTVTAKAAQDTGTLSVTATVKSNCDVTGGTLAFGDYVSGQTSNADAVGTIQIANCPNGTVKLELDGGGSGNTTDRRMTSGTNSLRYQLFRDVGRTLPWATGTDALNTTLPVTSPFNIAIYGRIPGAQALQPGNYTDNVTITMTF